MYKTSLHGLRRGRLPQQISPQSGVELVDILSHMGAEPGVFQDMKARFDHIRFHRASGRNQHHFHMVRDGIMLMQAGHLQYGKIPLYKTAAKYGIRGLQPPGALIPFHPLKAVFQVGQQPFGGAILKPQQNRPNSQGVAAQLIKNCSVGLIASVQCQAKVSYNGVAVFPQVLSN